MTSRRTVALVLISLIVGVVTAPASLLASAVAHLSDRRFVLADAEGFWWQGSAWLTVAIPNQPALTLPGRIEWTPEISLPGFRFEGKPWISVPFSAYWRRGLAVTAGEIRLPAEALQQLGPPFSLLRPTGKLTARWDNGEQLVIEWLDAASVLSPLPKLGDYRLTLRPGHLTLATINGPLHLNGEALPDKSFQGKAYSAPESVEKLAGVLNILGPSHQGVTTLQFKR